MWTVQVVAGVSLAVALAQSAAAAVPQTMRAAAIDKAGGPEVITLHTLPVPRPAADEVLIAVHTAGVASWDVSVRQHPHALKHLNHAGQKVIVAPAKRTDDQRQLLQPNPVQAQLQDGRPDQAAHQDNVAAALLVGKPAKAPELAERDPVMRVSRNRRCIRPSAQRKQHHLTSLSHHRVGDRERHPPGTANDGERAGRWIDWAGFIDSSIGMAISCWVAREVGRCRSHCACPTHASCSATALVRRIALASGLVPPRIKARTPATRRSPAHFPST